MEWYQKYANKNGFIINPDLKDIILEGLEHNKKHFGQRYCPCKINKIKENICPCKEVQETRRCTCMLFI
jgi:ferredoxin-thioredoxin reductase catalytic chain